MLSIPINIKNGEKYLERCLNSLYQFEDIILLDNYSTDKTLEIAKNYANVRIFEHEFCGMGKIRNLAAGFAKYDWVFFIDCDEILSPQLAQVLLNLSFEDGCIYAVLRHNFYNNYLIDTSSWGNDWVYRLYNRTQTCFKEHEVHESLVKEGMREQKLGGGCLYHFPYNSINTLIDKMQFYSTLYAQQHYGKKKPHLYSIPFRALIMFIKCYILKGGFKQGFEGLVISSYNAMGVFSKYIKLYELNYQRSVAIALNITGYSKDKLLQLLNLINRQSILPHEVIVLLNKDDIVNAANDVPDTTNKVVAEVFDIDRHLENNEIMELLQHNLVVKAKINYINGRNNIANEIQHYLNQSANLDNIISLSENTKLENKNFLRRCKMRIIAGKTISNTIVYTKNLKYTRSL